MDCMALILAGGKGSRLSRLTANLAKPAVIFGGKYRIIDFTLSNCTNSGISTAGLITQYHPFVLHRHVNNGRTWGFRNPEGFAILPPHQTDDEFKWYSGTANAVFQNMSYIDSCHPEHVLILSGDHIYSMNYNQMLQYHKKKNADLTISVIQVPMEEVSRFGIMKINKKNQIIEFQEKPEVTDSNLASMGIYIIRWQVLRDILLKDAQDEHSSHDFGKDIIPALLGEKREVFAFPFEGYWKDVGTVESYWEAHMDLLQTATQEELFSPSWPIYTNNFRANNPHYAAPTARIQQSIVVNGCFIEGQIIESVLSADVFVGRGAFIQNSIILPNAEIGENAFIQNAIIGPFVKIKNGRHLVGRPNDVLLVSEDAGRPAI